MGKIIGLWNKKDGDKSRTEKIKTGYNGNT
jgi:hypothetical protein